VNLAVEKGLIPVICLGETLKERENNKTFDIIQSQLNSILALENSAKMLHNAILAYEPVWAIGTGRTACPEQAEEVHAFIRQLIANKDAALASKMRILYGGSVKPNNAKSLFAMPNIDGGLVGGASLNVEEFTEICLCSL